MYISSTCQGNCNTTWKGGGGVQGNHSPVPLLGPPIYVWRCQGLLKKRQNAYCVEELKDSHFKGGGAFQISLIIKDFLEIEMFYKGTFLNLKDSR
jgi:hypothetical protein